MFGVGRDLAGHLVLLKRGHPQQAAQDHCQAGLEYLQRRRLHSLLTSDCPDGISLWELIPPEPAWLGGVQGDD